MDRSKIQILMINAKVVMVVIIIIRKRKRKVDLKRNLKILLFVVIRMMRKLGLFSSVNMCLRVRRK